MCGRKDRGGKEDWERSRETNVGEKPELPSFVGSLRGRWWKRKKRVGKKRGNGGRSI